MVFTTHDNSYRGTGQSRSGLGFPSEVFSVRSLEDSSIRLTDVQPHGEENKSYHAVLQGFGLFIVFLQLIPRIKDFIRYCGSDYTPSEVLRMELAILDRLHWDLCIGTPLDFLNIVSTGGLQSLP